LPVKNSGGRTVGLWLIGILLMQAAWVVALPPFRGMDEIDHAFRASGVAHGQWKLTDIVEGGRGEAVYVPAALVDSASGQCKELTYKFEFDCAPFDVRPDGLVGIATAAGSYNPLYYAVVGFAGKPFEGATSLYAMRIASALLCAMFLVAGLIALRLRRPPKLAWLAVATAMTPTLVYSTVVVAPNGLEIAAGFSLWAALLAVASNEPAAEVRTRWLLALAASAGVVLVTVRTLGPLWALLIVLCMVVAHGGRPSAQLVARHRLAFGVAIASVVAATVAALAWSQNTGLLTNPAAPATGVAEDSGRVFDIHGWVFQTVAAFPFRDQPAPLIVYPLVLILVAALLVMGLRRTQGRHRAALILAVVLSIAVPVVLVALTQDGQGSGWQGRYALPFVVGVLPMAAVLMDPDRVRRALQRPVFGVVAVSMLALAQAVSVASLQSREMDRDVSAHDAGWVHPPIWGTAIILLAGLAVLSWSLERSRPVPSVVA
jgi:hypothetical protein